MPEDGTYTHQRPEGFFWGFWHGWIAPISLIVSICIDSIRIYNPVNTGFWYGFGFYNAGISGFGGLPLSRKKRKKKVGNE